MQIGVVYPQSEVESEVAAIRAYGQGVDQTGYAHLLAYDHVVGADPKVHAPWTGAYDVDTTFQELFVLFGFLAGTTSLELVTGVIILPQRQTALVAKQAAQVDVLAEGRFRLGVGVGWNAVEYDSLGKDFGNRGRRFEEQIELLRLLWTERTVSFEGKYEQVPGAGIRPLPVQRPIPIWIGGRSAPAYRRMGRLADGWMPQMQPGPEFDEARRHIEEGAREVGRDLANLGLDARVNWAGDMGRFLAEVETWRTVGATHLSINTMKAGLTSVDEHLAVLARIASELGL